MHPLFSSSQLLALYWGLIRPCMEYCFHVWGDLITQLLNRVKSKVFRLHSLSHRRNVASLSFPYCYFYADSSSKLLTICFHLSHEFAAQGFLLFILILFIFLIQELTTIFTLTSLTLVNSGIFFLCLLFLLPMTWTLSSQGVKTPLTLKLTSILCFYFSYCPFYREWQQAAFFYLFLFACNRYPFYI